MEIHNSLENISACEIQNRFVNDGIVFPLRLMKAEQAAGYASMYYRFQQQAVKRFGREIYIKPHLVAPWIYEIARQPALLDRVAALLGDEILLWSSDIFNKPAGSDKRVGFHQDSPYWGLSPEDGLVSVWIALTASQPESGCMQVIPQTHNIGLLPHRKTYAPDNMLSVGQEVEYDCDSAPVTDVALQPGEYSIHHFNLIHGGQPNSSTQDRIGLVFRFIHPAMKQSLGPDSATLMRGRNSGGFELETPPETELGEAEMAQLRRVFAESPSGFGGQMLA